jgi:hypothetical protein
MASLPRLGVPNPGGAAKSSARSAQLFNYHKPPGQLRPKCCGCYGTAKPHWPPISTGPCVCDRHPGVWRTSVPLLERGLRASRDCDQRFCDRPTTSKQTAATKHSIRAKNFSGSTRIPSVSGESRQKTWRQNESAVPPPPGPRLKPRSVPGHPLRFQTQQKPSNPKNQMRQAHRQV